MPAPDAVLWRDFHGLHRSGWKRDEPGALSLVADAFAHPAKVRPDLAQKIVSHALAEGWWRAGDTLVDPFFGVGGFGLVGGFNGLRVVGVELEEHFVTLANANIALHDGLWGRNGHVRPVVIHGDSRNLGALVGAALGSVSSPPYAGLPLGQSDESLARHAEIQRQQGSKRTWGKSFTQDYGSTPGNLGNLPCGSVSSPPYAESLQNPGGGRVRSGEFKVGASTPANPDCKEASYGSSPGQLGAMPAGAVSSPPFEGSLNSMDEDWIREKLTTGPAGSTKLRGPRGARSDAQDYGDTAGQLGNERGTTFWDALREIATELYKMFPTLPARVATVPREPGSRVVRIFRDGAPPLVTTAVCAWVVKDFVRKGARVPFCDDCATLLAQCGFTVFERWRCWMVSKAKQDTMWSGTKPQKENKGFFRRLAEAKGSPRIDFEEVIWFAAAAKEQADG